MADPGTQVSEPTYLALTAEELQIAAAARSVLSDLVPIDRLHKPNPADLDPAVRRHLGELGWFGLVSPDPGDSDGLTPVEYALFFREVGRLCGPLDILAQSLAPVVARDDATLWEGLLSGDDGVALALPDGSRLRVLGGLEARFAVLAQPREARLLNLSGLRLDVRPPLDPGATMRVAATQEAGPSITLPGGRVWALAQLGAAAMLVGNAEATLDLIVDYAKIRETFGRKIGAYQAVRHPCAEMALRAEAARCQLWYAAASLKEGKGDASAQLDAAKHLANEAAVLNADVCIQLHGGIGLTDEHDAHLFLKRALLLSQMFGSRRALLSRLLDAQLED